MDPTPSSGTRYGVPARRKEITARLSEAYSQDMLDQREFERRLEQAEAAATIEELNALIADFGAPAAPGPGEKALVDPRTTPRNFSGLGDQSHVLVPGTGEAFQASSFLGSIRIDLRAYRGSGLTVHVLVRSVLGNTTLLVPPGTRIVQHSTTVLGDYQLRRAKAPGVAKRLFQRLFGLSDPAPATPFPAEGPPPTVVLTGWRALGNLEIEEALP